jgi:CRP-like cAMP-binding protein
MNLPEAQTLLRQQIEKFLPLPEEEWQLLVPHLSLRKLKKHELFAEEGKVSNQVALVLEGMLRQFYIRDGEEKTTYFYFEPHLMSDYFSCISKAPSRLTIEALSEVHLLVFPYSKMKELFNQSKTWERFGRLVAEYLAFGLEDRMVSLLTLSPEERYLELLTGNKKKILERIPQHYIANYLGITAVSLSRIRNRIQKGGD